MSSIPLGKEFQITLFQLLAFASSSYPNDLSLWKKFQHLFKELIQSVVCIANHQHW